MKERAKKRKKRDKRKKNKNWQNRTNSQLVSMHIDGGSRFFMYALVRTKTIRL